MSMVPPFYDSNYNQGKVSLTRILLHFLCSGRFPDSSTASRRLLALSVVSIFVIYLLLYLQFRSAKQALVVLLSLPLALIGGAAGGWLGMYAFRHKTKHWKFILGFPLIALVQLGLCVYLAAG